MEENKVAYRLEQTVCEGGEHLAWQIWHGKEWVGEFYRKEDAELWLNSKEPK